MIRGLEKSPPAPSAVICSDNSLSSFGRTLAITALVTIFTVAITALTKYVVFLIIHWWNQLFGGSVGASLALGHVAPEAPETAASLSPEAPETAVSMAFGHAAPEAAETAAQTGPELIARMAPAHVAPAAPEVVELKAGQGVVGNEEIVEESR